jgi:hypothetical protein
LTHRVDRIRIDEGDRNTGEAVRGTNDKNLYDKFVAAVVGFPPTARDGRPATQVFTDSYQLLSELDDAEKDPYPRARAWKAYALALSVYEGWPLPDTAPEKAMNSEARLNLARDLALAAIDLDPNDFDLHWAMADVHLIRKEFGDAQAEFEIALDLNRDERHPSLFAEAGSAMMQIGDLDQAQKYFRKSCRPDWHHWMRGILLYVEAGRAALHEETFLNNALDELKSTRTQLGDDFYQTEIQLVLAAVHWRKWKLLSEKAAAMPPGPSQALIAKYADRNFAAAQRAIRAFRAVFHYWSLDQALTALPFGLADDSAYWADAVTELWKIPL